MREFDAYDLAEEEALLAMGVIDAPRVKRRETPKIPADMESLYGHFLAARFGRAGDKLIARDPLNFKELDAYQRLTGAELAPWEVGVIMSIDALYTHRG